MKINDLNGGVMYTGGKFTTVLHDKSEYIDDADCSKVVDLLYKYGKENVSRIEYKYGGNTEVLYSRQQLG